MMNRQRDAEGVGGANHGQSDEDRVEAEAGRLGTQRGEGENAKGKGMWQRQDSLLLHPSTLLSFI